MLTDQEKQIIRDIRIHRILNIPDNGRKQMVKCVFHNDRSPSLLIDTQNGFHCFACGARGKGAIDFVMRLQNCSFREAINELADFL